MSCRFALGKDGDDQGQAAQRANGIAETPRALPAVVVDPGTGELAVASGSTLLQLFVQARMGSSCRFGMFLLLRGYRDSARSLVEPLFTDQLTR